MANSPATKLPLEDIMVAMDVVDTLRHRQELVNKELDAGGRRERLIEKLKRIYAAQGMVVTDEMLVAGVEALEQDRFKYTPPSSTFQHKLAKIYIARNKWLKPVMAVIGLCIAACAIYFALVIWPNMQARANLPNDIDSIQQSIMSTAKEDKARAVASAMHENATLALQEDDIDEAQSYKEQLNNLLINIRAGYKIRIVSRPNEKSGVWRVPDVNTQARNYYLVVEAIDIRGKKLKLPIKNEEDNETRNVSVWGLRVDRATFNRVKADKQDDGIIQNREIGIKRSGYLDPEYRIQTNGSTINRW